MGRLDGKVAIITGAGSGIGKQACLLFAQEGAHVVGADVNDEAGQATIASINAKEGPRAVYVHADVSKAADAENMVATAEKEFGKLNIIFNNAGIMHPADGGISETEERIWDLTMNINLKGVWLGCRYAVPAMQRAGGGSVINTASFVGILGAATSQCAYTASKGGVLALTREMAVQYARENIRFNSICPGPLQTPLLMDFLDTEEKKQRRLVHVPMGRFGQAIEIAKGALFLASDESSYVTGTDFAVDGGLTAAYVTPTGDTKSVAPEPLE